jgi:D-galactose 1-dehydrogenase
MASYSIAIIGLGKISQDQHVPVIGKDPRFRLAGVVSQRGLSVEGVPTYRTPADLYAAAADLDAVAICTPPSARHAIACEALAAGKHVLLEKPPTQTGAEFHDLVQRAGAAGRVIFATWHSRYNAAVDAARRRLAGRRLRTLHIEWKEDVRRWHPGQEWIWEPGGFGVFDPGINALSILTRIMPAPVFVTAAELEFPANRETPIAATLVMASPDSCVDGGSLTAAFDWRQAGDQTWTITAETAGGERLELSFGGSRLAVDGVLVEEQPMEEYEAIYRRFAGLLDAGESDMDGAPFQLVSDAFLVGRRRAVGAFEW